MDIIADDPQLQIVENLIATAVSSVRLVYNKSTSAEIEKMCRTVAADLPEDKLFIEELAPLVLEKLMSKLKKTKKAKTVSREDMMNSVLKG